MCLYLNCQIIQNYLSLSKECYDCDENDEDCIKTQWDAPNCISANGVRRDVMVINLMLPGPSIQICQNDRIRVRVENHLRNEKGTSIHWHGMLQRGTPYMDGISRITQCPIGSGTSFTYEYNYSLKNVIPR